jgi:chorismate mutase
MTTDETDRLGPLRAELDQLDRELADLVAARLRICARVARIKKLKGIAMMQPERVRHVQESYAARGSQLGLDPEFMRSVAGLLVDEACRIEQLIIDGCEEAGSG